MPDPAPPVPVDRIHSIVESIRYVFNTLWPIFLAIFGVALIGAFILFKPLREPALIAALSGLFTVVSTIGLAQRGPG